jgi:hypothetical protein
MERYDFSIVKGEDTIAALPSVQLPDPRAAWPHIIALAQKVGEPGSHIRVTNEDGDIVILTGINSIRRFEGASVARPSRSDAKSATNQSARRLSPRTG